LSCFRRKRKKIKNVYLTKITSPYSRAAYFLLKEKFKIQEVQDWLDFREEYIKYYQNLYGNLNCEYCGTKLTEKECTLDHVEPANGKKVFTDELAIACENCNSAKRAMPLLIFLLKREKH
jgi:5-methylcytosine-specific restriction endonuclease McrA